MVISLFWGTFKLPKRPGEIVWNGKYFLLLYVGKKETFPLSALGVVFHLVLLQKVQQKAQDLLACLHAVTSNEVPKCWSSCGLGIALLVVCRRELNISIISALTD
jgi:hypothetical protein